MLVVLGFLIIVFIGAGAGLAFGGGHACRLGWHNWSPWYAGVHDKVHNKAGWTRHPIEFRRCRLCKKLDRKVINI